MRRLAILLFVLLMPTLAWAKEPRRGTSRRAALAEVINDADSVVFESGDFREVAFQVKNAKDRQVIRAFGERVGFVGDRYDGSARFCLCKEVHPKLLRFERDGVVVASLLLTHHGTVSWQEEHDWFGELEFTREGRRALDALYERIGYSWSTFSEHQFAWWKARADRELAWIPEEVRSHLSSDDALRKLPDRAAFFAGASRLLGQKEVSLRYWMVMEESGARREPGSRHLHELARATRVVYGDEILLALKQLEGDPAGLLGAAQLFFIEEAWRRVPDPARGSWAVRLAQVFVEYGARTAIDETIWSSVITTIPQMPSDEVVRFLREILEEKDSLPKVTPSEQSYELPRQLGALLGLARMNAVTEAEVQSLRPRYQCKPVPIADAHGCCDMEAMRRNWKCESNLRSLDLAIELLQKRPAHLEDFRSIPPEILHAALDQLERAPTPEGISLMARDPIVLKGYHTPGDRERALRLFAKLTGWQMPVGLSRSDCADAAEKWWRSTHPEKAKP